jgi:DNA-directed RNA polymerase subunit RPC12/RpoP
MYDLDKKLTRKIQCPHCGNPYEARASSAGKIYEDQFDQWLQQSYKCPSCDKPAIFLQQVGTASIQEKTGHSTVQTICKMEMMAFPKYLQRACPKEVPEQLRGEYLEAVSVLEPSPKSCAALSRRIIQNIFHHHVKINKDNLYQEIDEYLKVKNPPSDVAETLHVVRELGNNAAHPRSVLATGEIIEVEDHEAHYTLHAVELLFDHVFVKPERQKAFKAGVNAKLAQAGKKPV